MVWEVEPTQVEILVDVGTRMEMASLIRCCSQGLATVAVNWLSFLRGATGEGRE